MLQPSAPLEGIQRHAVRAMLQYAEKNTTDEDISKPKKALMHGISTES